MTALTLTILGCGSSSGAPVIGCTCEVCQSGKPRNQRTRCSAWLNIGGEGWLIDTTPDLRTQALRERIPKVDGVLYTHAHADHLNGIDDLRAFCYRQQAAIPIYGSEFTLSNIQERFSYAFFPPSSHWNRPVLEAHVLPEHFSIAGLPVTHFTVPHGHWQTTAYRIGNLAWLTDLNHLTQENIAALQGVSHLFIDCLSMHPYPSHLSFEQACNYAEAIGAQHTYLIHMMHSLDYDTLSKLCPAGIAPAYDGLTISIPSSSK